MTPPWSTSSLLTGNDMTFDQRVTKTANRVRSFTLKSIFFSGEHALRYYLCSPTLKVWFSR